VPLLSGAEGSLEAELAETILAESGMEAQVKRVLGCYRALWAFGRLFPRPGLRRGLGGGFSLDGCGVSVVSHNRQTTTHPH